MTREECGHSHPIVEERLFELEKRMNKGGLWATEQIGRANDQDARIAALERNTSKFSGCEAQMAKLRARVDKLQRTTQQVGGYTHDARRKIKATNVRVDDVESQNAQEFEALAARIIELEKKMEALEFSLGVHRQTRVGHDISEDLDDRLSALERVVGSHDEDSTCARIDALETRLAELGDFETRMAGFEATLASQDNTNYVVQTAQDTANARITKLEGPHHHEVDVEDIWERLHALEEFRVNVGNRVRSLERERKPVDAVGKPLPATWPNDKQAVEAGIPWPDPPKEGD